MGIVSRSNAQDTTWIELGNPSNVILENKVVNGSSTSQINTIAIDNSGNVYAAGTFADSNGYAYVNKWNLNNYTSNVELGTGSNSLKANGLINKIVVDNSGNVYAAGNFTNSSNSYYVAKWNGSNWSELGGNNSLKANNSINSIIIDNSGNLYVVGNFTDSNGKYYVAKWDGSSWSELGSGSYTFNGGINSIILMTFFERSHNKTRMLHIVGIINY